MLAVAFDCDEGGAFTPFQVFMPLLSLLKPQQTIFQMLVTDHTRFINHYGSKYMDILRYIET